MTGRIWLVIAVCALFAGCHSSSDNGGAAPAGTLDIVGSTFKGPLLADGTIEGFPGLRMPESAALQGRTSTDDEGKFGLKDTLDQKNVDQFYTLRGYGRYIDEVTRLVVGFGATHALYRLLIGRPIAIVAVMTVLTTFIYWRAFFLRGILSAAYSDEQVLSIAEAQVAWMIGIPVISLYLIPSLVGTVAARKLFFFTLMIVVFALDVGIPAAEMMTHMAKDGMDGKFDGFSCGERIVTSNGGLQLSLTSMVTMKAVFLVWVATSENTFGFTADDPDLVAMCDRIAEEAGVDGIVLLAAIPVVIGVIAVLPRLTGETNNFVFNLDAFRVEVLKGPQGTLFSKLGDNTFASPDGFERTGQSTFRVESAKGIPSFFTVNLHEEDALTGFGSPRVGPVTGGTCVQIRGQFRRDRVYNVQFGSAAGVNTEVKDGSTLISYTPPGTGSVDVRVNGAVVPGGPFTYDAQPPANFGSFAFNLQELSFSDGKYQLCEYEVQPDGSFTGTVTELSLDTGETTTTTSSGQDDIKFNANRELISNLTITGHIRLAYEFDVGVGAGPGSFGMIGRRENTNLSGQSRHLTGVAIQDGKCWHISGQADFEDSKVDVRGTLSDGENVIPFHDWGTYTQNNGKLTFGGFTLPEIDTLTGFAHGHYISLAGKGPGMILHAVGGPVPSVVKPPGSGTYTGAGLTVYGDRVESLTANLSVRDRGLKHVGLGCDICCPVFFTDLGPIPLWPEAIRKLVFKLGPDGTVRDEENGEWGTLLGNGAFLASKRRPDAMGYGLFFPMPEFFTAKTTEDCRYKVLATGMSIGENESPFFQWSQRLGTAVPVAGGLVIDDEEGLEFGSKFRFDTIKTKDLTRDDEREVEVVNGGASSNSDYGLAFINNMLVLFPCEVLEFEDGSFCLWKGGLKWDGESGVIGSTLGFGTPWCGAFVKESETAPSPSGNYDVRFFSTQVLPNNIFAINGSGTSTWGGGNMTLDYTQIAKAELGGDPLGGGTPPNTTGTYTITPDGCLVPFTIDFNGFESEFCGIVDRRADTMYVMSLGGLGGLYVYTRQRTGTVTDRLRLCGLELNFPGPPLIEIGQRTGRMALRPTTADAFFERIIWNNGFEAMPRREIDIFNGFAIDQDNGSYDGTMTPGRDIAGEVGTGGNGAQAESGETAPSGGIDLTDNG